MWTKRRAKAGSCFPRFRSSHRQVQTVRLEGALLQSSVKIFSAYPDTETPPLTWLLPRPWAAWCGWTFWGTGKEVVHDEMENTLGTLPFSFSEDLPLRWSPRARHGKRRHGPLQSAWCSSSLPPVLAAAYASATSCKPCSNKHAGITSDSQASCH